QGRSDHTGWRCLTAHTFSVRPPTHPANGSCSGCARLAELPIEPRSAGPREGVALMIEAPLCVLLCVSAALLGLLFGYGGARLQDRFRLANAQTRVAELTQQATQKADSIVREAELRAKDEAIRKREEINRELDQGRAELREQERRLDKREDNLEQKNQVLLKKERALEHSQR